ncbi:hypothetical protein [Hymenobacter rigui]|uniref:LTD domain-containing protein n=1 Tax=Hymenobacter rigui TaxID=334424 RepID=A0A428KUC5_9BACT|nr:hypothetical protein [Hymenobacter rigui]RSK50117.1 hypothetical protein EI291_05550 [Hymenobacter rigui]
MGIQITPNMGLKITSTHNEKGKVEKIFVQAVRDVNLSDYLIYDTTFDDEEDFSNKGRHVYRFPTYQLAKGERAVLWIAEGPRGAKPTTIHEKPAQRFYWGRKGPVINNTGDNLTLVEISASKVYSTK